MIERWRPEDRDEILCLTHHDDPLQYWRDHVHLLQRGNWQAAYVDGIPVAVIGAIEATPGCWTVFGYGTEQWSKVTLSLSKYVKRELIPAVFEAGARLAMCWVCVNHQTAYQWLEWLGAEPHGDCLHLGKNGEPFRLMVWHRDKVAKSLDN